MILNNIIKYKFYDINLIYEFLLMFICFIILYGDWGLGIGVWGLGIGHKYPTSCD